MDFQSHRPVERQKSTNDCRVSINNIYRVKQRGGENPIIYALKRQCVDFIYFAEIKYNIIKYVLSIIIIKALIIQMFKVYNNPNCFVCVT